MTKKEIADIKKSLKEIKARQQVMSDCLLDILGDGDEIGLISMMTELWEKFCYDDWKEGFEAGKKEGFKLAKEKSRSKSH